MQIAVFFKVYLFTYFWLHWVFVSALQLSLAMVSRATVHCGVRASHGGGFSCCRAPALGIRASVAVAHGPSCYAACGIFPERGSNLWPPNWQMDPQPLDHQEVPPVRPFMTLVKFSFHPHPTPPSTAGQTPTLVLKNSLSQLGERLRA